MLSQECHLALVADKEEEVLNA